MLNKFPIRLFKVNLIDERLRVNMLIVVLEVKSTNLSFILYVTLRLFGDLLKIVYKQTNYIICVLREKN